MSKENKLPKIEKGVPMPGRHKEHGLAQLFKTMEKGDSVLLDIPQGGPGNFHTYARFAGVKIATRTQEGGKQLRIWRVE